MARPRIVRLPGGGEVVMKNVPAEEAERIKAYLLGKEAPAIPTSSTEEEVEEQPEELAVLNHVALGTYRDNDTRMWNVAVVSFNPYTKQAQVKDTHECGEYKEYAEERFKILSVNLEII
jgi:hypothetical protein